MAPSRWRREAAFGSLARAGHSVVAWEGRLLVFGGRVGDTFFAHVWCYNPAACSWEQWCERWPHAPRSYHSTTLVGGEVWLCGGSDAEAVVADALAFNPATRCWRKPQLRGDASLLRRTAHGACAHPVRPDCLLLQGGYGGSAQDYVFLSDLVEINTRSGVVRELRPSGCPPDARAYAGFVPLGPVCCACVAGRASGNRLVKGWQAVVVYDAAANRWLAPGAVGGVLAPRSSHRIVPLPAGGLLLFGGAVDGSVRAADLALLSAGPGGRLSWHCCLPDDDGEKGWPAARGVHAAAVLDGRFYVLGGYGEGRQYTGDCWSIGLEVVCGGGGAVPPAVSPPLGSALARPSGTCKVATEAEASQWREARRRCPVIDATR